jgi:hypothetical protein
MYMTDLAIAIPQGKGSKKQMRKILQEKLELTLADYRSVIGEKKFESRIRKAARSLGAEILKAVPKKTKKEKETTTEE